MQVMIVAENEISVRERVYLWGSFWGGLVLFAIALSAIWLWDGRYAITASIGVSALNTVAAVLPLLFNPPRKKFVRMMACVPLMMSLILTVGLQCREEMKQVIRDRVATETNELAKKIDGLVTYAVKGVKLSEDDERKLVWAISRCYEDGLYRHVNVFVYKDGSVLFSWNYDGGEILGVLSLEHDEIAKIMPYVNDGRNDKIRAVLDRVSLNKGQVGLWEADYRFYNGSRVEELSYGVALMMLRMGLSKDGRYIVDPENKTIKVFLGRHVKSNEQFIKYNPAGADGSYVELDVHQIEMLSVLPRIGQSEFILNAIRSDCPQAEDRFSVFHPITEGLLRVWHDEGGRIWCTNVTN